MSDKKDAVDFDDDNLSVYKSIDKKGVVEQ